MSVSTPIQKTVVPGEWLASEQEFLGGKNTFTDDEGNVVASATGFLLVDDEQRVVAVQNFNMAKLAKVGSEVIGQVMNVRDNTVGVRMLTVTFKGKKRVLSPSYAVIFISHVSASYVKNLRDHFKIGDFVKAEVSELTPFNVRLRTNAPSLGVIKAFCSNCRAPLHSVQSSLKCLRCNSVENRKLSSEYLLK